MEPPKEILPLDTWYFNSLEPNDELKLAVEDKKNSNANWLCGLCYETFHEQKDLEAHMMEIHVPNSKFQKCRICDKKFLARFLCLRHERMHKYDMTKPMCWYFPPKGKPIDSYVSNHFSEGVKRAKISDQYAKFLDLATNQVYKCLECEKVFADEELLREHYNHNHAVQKCIFCNERYESFHLLQDHQKEAHGYVYQKRNREGIWKVWQDEAETVRILNEYAKSSLAFFHDYAKSPEAEPVVSESVRSYNKRKAPLPVTHSKLAKKPSELISDALSKTLSEEARERERRIRRPPRRYSSPPPTAASMSSTKLSSQLASEHNRKPALPNAELKGRHDVTYARRHPIQYTNNTVREKSSNTPSKADEDLHSSQIVPSTANTNYNGDGESEQYEVSTEAEALDSVELQVETPAVGMKNPELNLPDINLSIVNSNETSPLNEAGYGSDDVSDYSDTPPKLVPMSIAEEARDPDEEKTIEAQPYEDEEGILFISEDGFVQSGPEETERLEPTKCPICDQQYDDSYALERHIKTHTSERPFSCQFCGQGFSTHSNRKEHERIHTGERPYVCPYCQKGFTQISNLKKHITTHKEQNLKCLKCGKQFVKEASLILHQRAHAADRRFRCHICDRAYNYASLLKRHMRIHTGELPYECDMCGMLFHELVSLHYHRKKIHTGERPHKCETCGRAFILSSDLKKHQNIHNKDVQPPSSSDSPVENPRLKRARLDSSLGEFPLRKLGNNRRSKFRRIEEEDEDEPSNQVLIEFDTDGQLIDNGDTGQDEIEYDNEGINGNGSATGSNGSENFSDDDLETTNTWLKPEVQLSFVDENLEFSD